MAEWIWNLLLLVAVLTMIFGVILLRRWAGDAAPSETRDAATRRTGIWLAAGLSIRSSRHGSGDPGGATLGGTRSADRTSGVDP